MVSDRHEINYGHYPGTKLSRYILFNNNNNKINVSLYN